MADDHAIAEHDPVWRWLTRLFWAGVLSTLAWSLLSCASPTYYCVAAHTSDDEPVIICKAIPR